MFDKKKLCSTQQKSNTHSPNNVNIDTLCYSDSPSLLNLYWLIQVSLSSASFYYVLTIVFFFLPSLPYPVWTTSLPLPSLRVFIHSIKLA